MRFTTMDDHIELPGRLEQMSHSQAGDSTKMPSASSRQVGGDHYRNNKIQPIEYILANELGFCEANIVKYITRYKHKGGVQDIDKVIHYAELLKEHINAKD